MQEVESQVSSLARSTASLFQNLVWVGQLVFLLPLSLDGARGGGHLEFSFTSACTLLTGFSNVYHESVTRETHTSLFIYSAELDQLVS